MEALAQRFIPAWAGNTRSGPRRRPRYRVHPRVGGEHRYIDWDPSDSGGSSPRGRGTHVLPDRRWRPDRFIPAWAGNTRWSLLRRWCSTVHPRVGGEHIYADSGGNTEIGSSPRGRGTPPARGGQRSRRRFIPAWAGNTGCSNAGRATITVHPRVGGEHPTSKASLTRAIGSSPRGRGTLFLEELDMACILRCQTAHRRIRHSLTVHRWLPLWRRWVAKIAPA